MSCLLICLDTVLDDERRRHVVVDARRWSECVSGNIDERKSAGVVSDFVSFSLIYLVHF